MYVSAGNIGHLFQADCVFRHTMTVYESIRDSLTKLQQMVRPQRCYKSLQGKLGARTGPTQELHGSNQGNLRGIAQHIRDVYSCWSTCALGCPLIPGGREGEGHLVAWGFSMGGRRGTGLNGGYLRGRGRVKTYGHGVS